MPTETEFSVLETLAEVIKPLSVLTDALSGEKEVTSSAVQAILKYVVDICEPKDGDNTLTCEMKLAISSDLRCML